MEFLWAQKFTGTSDFPFFFLTYGPGGQTFLKNALQPVLVPRSDFPDHINFLFPRERDVGMQESLLDLAHQIAQSQSLAISALTKPNRQKSAA